MTDALTVAGLHFLRSAFDQLREQHILPRPKHLPWIKVGTDYFGPEFETPERTALQHALVEAFPKRLADGSATGTYPKNKDSAPEFNTRYTFPLLESAVAHSTMMPDEEAQNRAINELISFLATEPNEVSCHRIVSHLKVDSPLTLGGENVKVTQLDDDGWIDVHALTKLPGLETEQLFLFQTVPHVVLSAQGSITPSFRAYDQIQEPSQLVGRAVLGLRIFRRTSARNIVEWSGFTEPGGFTRPIRAEWQYDSTSASALSDAEETARLSDVEQDKFNKFTSLIDETTDAAEAAVTKRKLGASGWFYAINSFQDSFSFDPWPEQVPRLIRTMEGALLPEPAAEAVKARLRQRLCLLLQSDTSSCNTLFEAVGHLYDLRSEVEHAADVKAAKQINRLRKVARSTSEPAGISQQRAIEELRELARRSIVVRIILATGSDPLWPIEDVNSIDQRLLEDSFRQRCREQLMAAQQEFGPGLL